MVLHSSSLAENKFTDSMIRFMKTASEQMGIELFVLAGYQNTEGAAMKMKYDTFLVFHGNLFNRTLYI